MAAGAPGRSRGRNLLDTTLQQGKASDKTGGSVTGVRTGKPFLNRAASSSGAGDLPAPARAVPVVSRLNTPTKKRAHTSGNSGVSLYTDQYCFNDSDGDEFEDGNAPSKRSRPGVQPPRPSTAPPAQLQATRPCTSRGNTLGPKACAAGSSSFLMGQGRGVRQVLAMQPGGRGPAPPADVPVSTTAGGHQSTIQQFFPLQNDVARATALVLPAGMVNHGNTCYLNATLQALLALPCLLYELHHVGLAGLVLPHDGVVAALQRCALEQQALLDGTSTSSDSSALRHTAISPSAVKAAMGKRSARWRGSRQEDAHEFLTELLDQVQSEVLAAQLAGQPLPGPTAGVGRPAGSIRAAGCNAAEADEGGSAGAGGAVNQQCHSPALDHAMREGAVSGADVCDDGSGPASMGGVAARPSADVGRASDGMPVLRVSEALCPASRTFLGCLELMLECCQCGHRTLVKEQFTHLSLDLPRGAGLFEVPRLEALLDAFFAAEVVDKSCSSCGAECARHTVQRAIRRLPRVLLVHLKRFQVEILPSVGAVCRKVRTRVRPSPTLNVSAYCAPGRTLPPLLANLMSSSQPYELPHGRALAAAIAQLPAPCPKPADSPSLDKENRLEPHTSQAEAPQLHTQAQAQQGSVWGLARGSTAGAPAGAVCEGQAAGGGAASGGVRTPLGAPLPGTGKRSGGLVLGSGGGVPSAGAVINTFKRRRKPSPIPLSAFGSTTHEAAASGHGDLRAAGDGIAPGANDRAPTGTARRALLELPTKPVSTAEQQAAPPAWPRGPGQQADAGVEVMDLTCAARCDSALEDREEAVLERAMAASMAEYEQHQLRQQQQQQQQESTPHASAPALQPPTGLIPCQPKPGEAGDGACAATDASVLQPLRQAQLPCALAAPTPGTHLGDSIAGVDAGVQPSLGHELQGSGAGTGLPSVSHDITCPGGSPTSPRSPVAQSTPLAGCASVTPPPVERARSCVCQLPALQLCTSGLRGLDTGSPTSATTAAAMLPAACSAGDAGWASLLKDRVQPPLNVEDEDAQLQRALEESARLERERQAREAAAAPADESAGGDRLGAARSGIASGAGLSREAAPETAEDEEAQLLRALAESAALHEEEQQRRQQEQEAERSVIKDASRAGAHRSPALDEGELVVLGQEEGDTSPCDDTSVAGGGAQQASMARPWGSLPRARLLEDSDSDTEEEEEEVWDKGDKGAQDPAMEQQGPVQEQQPHAEDGGAGEGRQAGGASRGGPTSGARRQPRRRRSDAAMQEDTLPATGCAAGPTAGWEGICMHNSPSAKFAQRGSPPGGASAWPGARVAMGPVCSNTLAAAGTPRPAGGGASTKKQAGMAAGSMPLSKQWQQARVALYTLVAVVLHTGPLASSGHFVADVLHMRSPHLHQWLHYDDSRVTPTTQLQVTSECERDGYLLFYANANLDSAEALLARSGRPLVAAAARGASPAAELPQAIDGCRVSGLAAVAGGAKQP